MHTKARTYTGFTGTQAFNGFKGLRIDQRFTDVVQDDNTMLVAAVDAQLNLGLMVSSGE